MQQDNGRIAGDALPRKTLLGNRYKIWQTLGQGGFGITYRAYDEVEQVEVVVKENLPSDCARWDSSSFRVVPMGGANAKAFFEDAYQHFYREAQVLSTLNHPNIVRVTDAFKAAGTAFYVMPWVGDQDLRSHVESRKESRGKYLKYVLKCLLDALDYIHQRQLLHRDIKPSNILCNNQGEPILIDFGAVRRLDSDRTHTMMGTPHYVPIEQIRSNGNIGPWSDLYALGATMYVLLTGNKPPASTDRLIGKDPYVPLTSYPQFKSGKLFEKSFLKGIDKALRVMPEDRWQSAREWLETLREDDIRGETPSLPRKKAQGVDARRGWLVVALAVAILIIVILSIIICRMA